MDSGFLVDSGILDAAGTVVLLQKHLFCRLCYSVRNEMKADLALNVNDLALKVNEMLTTTKIEAGMR